MTALALPRTFHRNPLRDGLIVAFILTDLALLFVWGSRLTYFYDAESWWGIDLGNLYGQAVLALDGVGAFRFSPVAGQVMAPLGLLPWPVFIIGWTALQLAAALWIGGRRYWWLVLIIPVTLLELEAGNIHLLMAAAVVISFRHPAAWGFLLLTKVTPGVGVLWFAFRREWRSFAVALGVTAAIVAAGFALTPDLWRQWIDSLAASANNPQIGYLGPVQLRLLVAVPILFYAAKTDRRWLVPVAVLLAMPSIWLHSLAILLACIPLYQRRPRYISLLTSARARRAKSKKGRR